MNKHIGEMVEVVDSILDNCFNFLVGHCGTVIDYQRPLYLVTFDADERWASTSYFFSPKELRFTGERIK